VGFLSKQVGEKHTENSKEHIYSIYKNMLYTMKKIFVLLSFLFVSIVSFGQLPDVRVKNEVFDILYSQSLEQPLIIKYRSTNRPTNVNRGHMDFYTEKAIKTSDGEDYKGNVYDKGHGAPAATFSDNEVNLKQTFSYLNSIMQNQYLNRGEWRMLEEQIRKWDDTEPNHCLNKNFL
jgi:DNA/RNA endonuclease G (NUC1)